MARHTHRQQSGVDLGRRTRRARQTGEERTLTYKQLHREVCLFANVLKRNGIKKGDRVIIYLPMIPEAAIAMLACTRIGAVHSVVFGGFSAQSVADRIADCQAKMVITADGGFRRGAVVPLKKNVDEALTLKDAQGKLLAKTIEKVIVVRRAGNEVTMQAGRDVWWHRGNAQVDADCPAEKMDSEAPLVHSLHQRFDRQTEGNFAHHRRLSARREDDDKIRFRSAR